MHRQSVIVKAPRSFVEQILWPGYQGLSAALSAYLSETTEKQIREDVHGETADAEERGELKQLARQSDMLDARANRQVLVKCTRFGKRKAKRLKTLTATWGSFTYTTALLDCTPSQPLRWRQISTGALSALNRRLRGHRAQLRSLASSREANPVQRGLLENSLA